GGLPGSALAQLRACARRALLLLTLGERLLARPFLRSRGLSRRRLLDRRRLHRSATLDLGLVEAPAEQLLGGADGLLRRQIGGPGGDLPVLDDPEPAEAAVDRHPILRLASLAADAHDLPRADLRDVLDLEAVGLPAVEVVAHRLLHLVALPDQVAVGTGRPLVPTNQG